MLWVVAYSHEADISSPARTLWVAMRRLASVGDCDLRWWGGDRKIGGREMIGGLVSGGCAGGYFKWRQGQIMAVGCVVGGG